MMMWAALLSGTACNLGEGFASSTQRWDSLSAICIDLYVLVPLVDIIYLNEREKATQPKIRSHHCLLGSAYILT